MVIGRLAIEKSSVLVPLRADHEWVVAGVDLEQGVPRAAHERVVTAVRDERVVAGPADQAVGTRTGHEQVVGRAGQKRRVAAVADRARRDSETAVASTRSFEPSTSAISRSALPKDVMVGPESRRTRP